MASVASEQSSGRDAPRRNERAVCVFRVAGRAFALDVAAVGEVVNVERVVEVPLVAPEIRGLFSLRGQPVPLLDLSAALAGGEAQGQGSVALVLRLGKSAVALAIEGVVGVLPAGSASLSAAPASGPAGLLGGYLESSGQDPIAVVSGSGLSSAIARLSSAVGARAAPALEGEIGYVDPR